MRPAPLTGSGVGGLLLLPWAAVTVGVVLRLSFDDELRFDACGRKEPAHTSCSGDGQGPAGAARCRWGPSSSVPPAAGAPGNHGAAAAAGHWGSKAPTNIKRLDFTKLNIIKYLLLNACYAGKGTAAFPAGGSSRFPKGTGHAPSQHNPSVQRPAPRHLLVLGTLGTLGTLGMPGVAALAPGCWGYPMADSSSGSVFTTTSCFTPAQPFPGEEKAKFGFSGCESSWWPSNAATCSMVLGWARRGQNLPQGEWSPPAPPSPGQRPPQQLLAAQRGSSPTKPPSKLGPGGSRHGQVPQLTCTVGSRDSPEPLTLGVPRERLLLRLHRRGSRGPEGRDSRLQPRCSLRTPAERPQAEVSLCAETAPKCERRSSTTDSWGGSGTGGLRRSPSCSSCRLTAALPLHLIPFPSSLPSGSCCLQQGHAQEEEEKEEEEDQSNSTEQPRTGLRHPFYTPLCSSKPSSSGTRSQPRHTAGLEGKKEPGENPMEFRGGCAPRSQPAFLSCWAQRSRRHCDAVDAISVEFDTLP